MTARTALLVLGMHRSGTSAATRLFNLLGADLPANLLAPQPDNPTGFWESNDIMALHDRLFLSLRTTWHDPLPVDPAWFSSNLAKCFEDELLDLLWRDFEKSRLFIIKDPRICKLVPLWRNVLRRFDTEPRFLLLLRNPAEVARSLQRRNGFTMEKGLLLWLVHTLVSERETRSDSRSTISFEELLCDWKRVVESTSEDLSIEFPHQVGEIPDKVDSFLHKGNGHGEFSNADMNAVAGFGEWLLPVYRELLRCAGPERKSPDQGVLDAAFRQVLGHMEKLRPILEEQGAYISELEERSNKLTASLDRIRGELASHKTNLEQAQEIIAAYKTELDRERQHARDVAAVYEAELKRQRQSAGVAIVAHERAQAEIMRLEGEVGHNKARWQAMERSHSWRITSPIRYVKLQAWYARRAMLGRIKSWSGRGSVPRGQQSGPTPELDSLLEEEFPGVEKLAVIRHFIEYGLPFRQTEKSPGLPAAKEIAQWVAAITSLDSERHEPDPPDISIVIPVYNNIRYTLSCIHSVLRQPSRYSYEIIVGDDCSTDATREVFQGGLGKVRHVRNESNLGFIANCNHAAAGARGRYLVFLNNDTLVLPHWLDELVETLDKNPEIGLAGSKLVYPDGRLQEAGGLVWRDGSAWNYGRGDDPRKPEYCYMRDVDYCSGASIAVSRQLWEQMQGFDDYYDVAYCEDADLAFRIRDAGFRTVLQPLSALIHFEGVTSGTDVTKGVKAYQVENGKKFFARWEKKLEKHRPNGNQPECERERDVSKRILIVDHITPEPDKDAGSITCLEIIKTMVKNGIKVTFVPETNFCFTLPGTRDLQRIGVECIYGPYCTNLMDVLERYGGHLDYAFIFRAPLMHRCIPYFDAEAPDVPIIFHTSDLHHVRELREAKLEGNPEKMAQAYLTQANELAAVKRAAVTIVHSRYEKDVLEKEVPNAKVYLIPWIFEVKEPVMAFAERRDIAFVGSYLHTPNVDAVNFFVTSIWPGITEKLPDVRFRIVGSNLPESLAKYDGHNRVQVDGYVEDLDSLLESIKLTVAPLRYGAGLKGKVAVSLSRGVPCVTTNMGAEGMDLTEGDDILVADDPDKFADAVIRLYKDEVLWSHLSEGAVKFARRNFDTEVGEQQILDLLKAAESSRGTGNAVTGMGDKIERVQ